MHTNLILVVTDTPTGVINSITCRPEMQRAKLPLVFTSHSQKGVNVLINTLMCYHCLWEEVLVVVSADVKVRLRNQVFHTFQSAVPFLLYVIHFKVYSLV